MLSLIFEKNVMLLFFLLFLIQCSYGQKDIPVSKDTIRTILDTISTTKFQVTSVIDVRLVGFQKNNGGDLTMSISRLTEVLDEMHTTLSVDHSNVHTIRENSSNKHSLDIKQKVLFRVSHVKDQTLLQQVEAHLREQVYQKEETKLPVSIVNTIIQKHLLKQPHYGAYVIYFLNPNIPKVRQLDNNGIPDGWRQPIYWYVEDEPKELKGKLNKKQHLCGFQSYVDPNNRFVWMDVAAGPSDQGPRTFGEGDVSEYTSLSGSNRWDMSSITSSGDLAGQMANQVWIARQHIFLPPLLHMQDPRSNFDSSNSLSNRKVLQIVVHDVQHMNENLDDGGGESSGETDWNYVKEALKNVAPAHQTIKFIYER